MGFIRVLNRPYPLASASWRRLLSAIIYGGFVFLFLWIFTPFGLEGTGNDLLKVCVGYGAVTTGAMLAIYFLLRPALRSFYNESSWTVGKEVTHTLGAIVLIAFGNAVYSGLMNFFELSAKSIVIFLGFTVAVGIFPISIQVLLRQNRLQKKYTDSSENTNSVIERNLPLKESQSITFTDEDNKEVVCCELAELVAMESADNYVKIYIANSDGVKMTMARSALGRYENQLATHASIFRTHRSYLVNLGKVAHVTGNARGYTLQLDGMDKDVPVARRRIEAFDKAMASH